MRPPKSTAGAPWCKRLMGEAAVMDELTEALAVVKGREEQLASAVEERDQVITRLHGEGVRAMDLAIASGLTPARIYQIIRAN